VVNEGYPCRLAGRARLVGVDTHRPADLVASSSWNGWPSGPGGDRLGPEVPRGTHPCQGSGRRSGRFNRSGGTSDPSRTAAQPGHTQSSDHLCRGDLPSSTRSAVALVLDPAMLNSPCARFLRIESFEVSAGDLLVCMSNLVRVVGA